jgi:hypothetical protein
MNSPIHVRRWLRIASIALLIAALGAPAEAKLCGDDVGGQDVPCSCGDTVASNVTLSDDPVTSTRCESDGLIVRATSATSSITVDLNGQTLRGSGRGAGVWVLQGGPGGARIVSTGSAATVEGFRDGVVAHGNESIALLEDIVARASTRDGIRLFDVKAAEIRNTESLNSGRDGFSMTGKDNRLIDTRSVGSQRHGYNVMGGGFTLGVPGGGNVAEGNGHIGFSIMGMGHHLSDCVATDSGRHGMRASGGGYQVSGCLTQGNGGNGIQGTGMNWRLAGNQALDNGNNGIVVNGANMLDEGGNTGSGNQGLGQQKPVVQCSIGRSPCQP